MYCLTKTRVLSIRTASSGETGEDCLVGIEDCIANALCRCYAIQGLKSESYRRLICEVGLRYAVPSNERLRLMILKTRFQVLRI